MKEKCVEGWLRQICGMRDIKCTIVVKERLIIDDFKVEGKVPVVMERFTIWRIVGDISLEIFISTVVGT